MTATPPPRPQGQLIDTRTRPGVGAPGRAAIAQRTLRTDRWWAQPIVTVILLVGWVLYAVIRTATQQFYFVEEYHYLSPFSSPCVSSSCNPEALDFGVWFGNFPPLIPFGIVVLPFLLGFRLTCYYYRKAYYRAFTGSPAACAVPEPHAKAKGETRFPLILQNSHRYFFYGAMIVGLIITYDAIRAFQGADGGFGIGLGTLIMVANVALVWAFTLGCNSCRHVIGGRLKHFSKHPVRYRAWTWVSKLNGKHMQFAWASLGSLAATDAYIALVSSGVINDLRIFN